MLQGETVNGSAGVVFVRLQIGEVVVEEVLLDLGFVSSYRDSECSSGRLKGLYRRLFLP
jgi:hypothetical protein